MLLGSRILQRPLKREIPGVCGGAGVVMYRRDWADCYRLLPLLDKRVPLIMFGLWECSMYSILDEWVMRHGIGSCLGLNEIGSPSSIIIFIIISYLFNRTF